MEFINCIFCGTDNSNKFIHENGYIGIKCDSCNLIYINPRPRKEEIIDLYGHDNAHASANSHIKFAYGKQLYSKHTLRIINKYTNGKLLEIGAGAGYFLKEARKQGFKVFGIEFNKIQAKFINEQLSIPCELKELNGDTFNDTKFDIIYHCDVISHFYNPIKEFEKIHLKLNDNGYVIFETGNFGDVEEKYFKYISKFQYPDHLFFFSERNIITLLEHTGFELIQIYRYSIFPQLVASKIIKKITRILKPNYSPQNLEIKGGYKKEFKYLYYRIFYFFKRYLKNFYTYLFYIIRYKIGLVVPKEQVPQTLIVVAKKKNENPMHFKNF